MKSITTQKGGFFFLIYEMPGVHEMFFVFANASSIATPNLSYKQRGQYVFDPLANHENRLLVDKGTTYDFTHLSF